MPKAKQKEAETQTGATAGAVTETVQRIPLSDLHPFEGHPFKVLDDDSMAETVDSIVSQVADSCDFQHISFTPFIIR